MRSFQHYNARSIREAAALLAKHNGKAKVIAGGTDLIGSLKNHSIPNYPETLINIKGIRGLDSIKAGSRGIKIGALTKLADIVQSPDVRRDYPLLEQAARSVAAPNIRNMATVGGNLAQDVRCWYYRYPKQIGGPIVCLRKGGKTCNALAGDNRYHSIFGAAPAAGHRSFGCFAVAPSDLAVALVALGASIVTTKRVLDAQYFFSASVASTTVLEPDELIKEIRIPKPSRKARQRYLKFTLRKPVDFAIVSVASVVEEKGGVCGNARIVLGAVAPSPVRATQAEEFLKGKAINELNAEEAAKLAFADARPLSMNAYKVEIGRTLVKRSILAAPE